MARAIWKGSISFGLVTIPMQLHTAVREHRPKFRLLHARDKSPIKYERVCQRDGTPVAWADLVKGYEYEKGRYVVLTKDDLRAAALEKDRRIQILDFVPERDIDERFFDQPYYVAPDKGSEHAYAVFVRALGESGRVGIGKIVLRDRQHLCAIEAHDGMLVLTMMRFADELVDMAELPKVAPEKVPARELKLATDLIGAMAAEWKPEQYTDDYLANLQKLIDQKLKGETIRLADADTRPRAEVVDLAERLRQSLAAAQGRGAGAGGGKAAPKSKLKAGTKPKGRNRAKGATRSKRARQVA